MKKILLLLFFVFSLVQIQAQEFDFNHDCRKAYQKIINLEFKEARKYLDKEIQKNPDNLITLYLENYIDFLKIIIGENKEEFEQLEENKSKRLKKIEEGPDDSPFKLYCEANINLQWAFARIKFEEYFTAFFEIHRAYNKLHKNQELYPEFLPNKIGLGLLHTLIGSIPDNYKWVSNMIGLKGNVNQGLDELRSFVENAETSDTYEVFLPECLFFFSFIQMNIGFTEKEAKWMQRIFAQKEFQSPLLYFVKANFFFRQAENNQALQLLKEYQISDTTYPFYYLIYLRGMAKLQMLDTSSRNEFLEYLHNFGGINYLASACQKIAWTYLLEGDTLAYEREIGKSLQFEKSVVGADHQAKKEAGSKTIPHVGLLKARLLFDGGYYANALKELNETSKHSLQNTSQKAEYFYRYGRVFQQMHRFEEALNSYERCIQLGYKLPEYFAANAALQSGIIYELLGQKQKAAISFQECLNMDFEEYEKSIKHKAKARLEALK